jgi:amino acid adenylation domain-containing protein
MMIQKRLKNSLDKFKDRTAVQYGDKTVTYSLLKDRANHIANCIIEKAIKKETFIGVLLDDRLEFIIAMLGILKAGCVFVPLDPSYPDARLEMMMDTTGTTIVISDRENAGRFENRSREFIYNEDLFSTRTWSVHEPESRFDAEDKIYIYFTSGTTGIPRAFVGKNKSLVHFIDWEIDRFEGEAYLRVSQFTTPGFDAYLRDVFVPLCSGGVCCIPVRMEDSYNPEKLAAWIERSGVHIIHCVPSVFRLLSTDENVLSGSLFRELKYILMSGERLNPSDLNGWYDRFGDRIKLVNLWGTSETTLAKTYYLIRESDRDRERIPVGKAIDGAMVVVLDENMNMCDPLESGELYIRTPYRTYGYLNDPGLNSEKFIINPFNKDPNDLLHKTGDIGRLLQDGNIDLLGRVDRQMKIQGVRIEPEEIENLLVKHFAVKEAVVVKKGSANNEFLCVFFTWLEKDLVEEEVLLANLNEYLTENLPNFMVPSRIVRIDQLPRTPRGKIDYEKLPDPLKLEKKQYIAPRDPVETKLSRLWSTILNIETISIDARFIEIGGNSLNLMSLISKIHREFDVTVTLAQMFNNQTIEKQAQIIRVAQKSLYLEIKPAAIKDHYSLSSAQKRLFFLHQLDTSKTTYNMPQFFLIQGEPERQRFDNAFKNLVKRHESFRTSFKMVDNEPVQQAHEDVPFEIRCCDVKESKTKEESESRIMELAAAFVKPFDLAEAPLLRVGLIELSQSECLLMVDMHHIISDGTSMGLLVNEFRALYDERLLPPMKLQYKDYAEWQNSSKKQEIIREQGEFWEKEFAATAPVLNLPTDYNRPDIQDFDGRTLNFDLDKDTSDRLNQLAAAEDVTLFMMLLAIFNVLLSRLSAQEDIVVGTGIEGRRHEDLRNIIGMFVNTLPLRNYPLGSMTFRDFLVDVKKRTLDAFENQEYQFEDLVENLNVTRDTGRNPLFDVMFQLEDAEVPAIALPGLRLDKYNVEKKISKFDLTLFAIKARGLIQFSLEYGLKLYKESTIKLFIDHFCHIVLAVLDNPAEKLARLMDIRGKKREELLFHLNEELAAEVDELEREWAGNNMTLQDMLKNQFDKFPYRLALQYGEKALTYSLLNEETDIVARGIISRGIARGTFIGLLIDDRMKLITAAIAILKAGCVFLPFDSDYPLGRLRLMGGDVDLGTVIVEQAILDTPEILEIIKTGDVDLMVIESFFADRASGVDEKDTLSNTRYSPQDNIYIYFTSGTTGRPKPMVGKNRGLLHFIRWEIDTFNVDQTFHFSQLTTPVFDAFLRDVFVPLCSGGTICIPAKKGTVQDADQLIGWVEKSALDAMHCVPGVFRLFNSRGLTQDHFKTLKFILFSGEKTNPSDLVKWFDTFNSRVQLCNLWGTSETTLAKTCYFIRPHDINRGRMPVGNPIKGARAVILDNEMNLCDKLIPGEIYIKTPYRTHGYYNDPQLNREKFIQNPFNDDPEDLLHRTGDLGRFLADGTIDVLGRTDRQVKVRGVRVELGEIESLLQKHPDVIEAVVIQKSVSRDNSILCAYVTENLGIEVKLEELVSDIEQYAAGYLPEYMIPSQVIPITEIPRLPSGKIDYDSLPDPLALKVLQYIPPRDHIEEKLARLWSEILTIDKIGVTIRFFDLGGNSLNLMALISRIHKEFDVRISLGEIFNNPTIETQAAIIRGTVKDIYGAIEPVEKKEYYPLSSSQRRLYLIQQMDLDSIAYNLSQGFIIITPNFDRQRFNRAYSELVRRHEGLRTAFIMVKGEPVQRVHDEVDFQLRYYELEKDFKGLGEEDLKEVMRRLVVPFDLAKAPLFRASAVKINENVHLLLTDLHHIITDGASEIIFKREFIKSYAGRPLADLKIQYKDFSAWQNNRERMGEIKKQEQYWLERFSDGVPDLRLPLDYPRPPYREFKGSEVVAEVGRKLTAKIKQIAVDIDTTLYMVLLAAFNILFSKITGQSCIVVGSPISGRTHVDLKYIIGLFANMIALKNMVDEDLPFDRFLEDVKRNALDAYDNQDFQFDELVQVLKVKRDPGRHPIFDAVFILQDMRLSEVEPDTFDDLDFKLEHNDPEVINIQHDLILNARENDNSWLRFKLQYSTTLFKESTARGMLDHFVEILEQVAEDRSIKLKDISVSYDIVEIPAVVEDDQSDFEF